MAQVRQDILGSVITEQDDLVHIPPNPECSLAGEITQGATHPNDMAGHETASSIVHFSSGTVATSGQKQGLASSVQQNTAASLS